MKDEGPLKTTSSREVYRNPWIKVREDNVVDLGGKNGVYGVVTMKSGVTVVALTTNGNILLAREYKYAAERFTLECISGGVDGDESLLGAAERELREEVGAESEMWTELGRVDPFTSIVFGPNHMFLAEGVSVVGEQDLDDGEVVSVVEIPFEEAVQKVRDGEITHAASVVAILKVEKMLNGR